jgi:hypothetical protein
VHKSSWNAELTLAEEQMKTEHLRLAGWIAADALLVALIIAALFHGMFLTPLILAALLTGAVAETAYTAAGLGRDAP